MTLRVGLRQQRLDDVDRGFGERARGRSHIEPPDPEVVLTNQLYRIATLLLERANPMPKRHRIMLAQTLDIPHLEARTFRGGNHVVRSGQLSIGEDVGVDERIHLPELPENFLA